jgi:uncharacterized membrane protein YozB (DUF420 family)
MNPAVLSLLPSLNAGLNATSVFLILLGFVLIRQGAWTGHALCMCAALGTSALFLVSYLTYHYFHGATPFPGEGWTRPAYFTLLISHTVLAAVVLPMVLVSLYHALRSRFEKHVRIARVTFPVWLYVSFTGVLIYWILYRLF